ncbi:DUF3147 family protein [Actinoplanes awajinensis]|uniref:DUF3147 family protein n=1 Tax=Actinoplanes awajinensis TaxID=135946 RepID=UPI000829D2B9|nr:DUF3147 family protein [Actinoplanes awajinensis]
MAEVALKALSGGLLVLVFAALSKILKPERFAGVFSAAPSVALGSLAVTLVFSGTKDLTAIGSGMAVGAVAFVVYCVATAPLVRRFGAWQGSAGALLIWATVAAAGYAVVLS